MKKEVYLVLFMLVIFNFQTALSSAVEEKTNTVSIDKNNLQKELQRISYNAKEFETGNIDYAKLTVKNSQAVSKINTILNSQDTKEEQISSVLGEAGTTNTVTVAGSNTKATVEEALSEWKDIVFDGQQIQVRTEIAPILDEEEDEERITHQANVRVNFADDASSLDVGGSISVVQDLAKTYALSEADVQTANDLARQAANLQNLFDNYVQQNKDECEDIMLKIFGEANKVADLEIVTRRYEIYNNNNVKAFVELQLCENCQGDVPKFTNAKINLEKDGRVLQGPPTTPVPNQFEDFGSSAFRQDILSSLSTLDEFLKAENYDATFSAIERFEAAVSEWNEQENNVWNDVKNLADPKKAESSKRAEYFIARSKFLLDVFEGNPMTSQIDEQQEFSLTLSQKYEENGEEICTNKIDDNNNEKIDCADNLCSGQVCGTQTITEGNDTREEELYCISGTCQALQITTKTAEPVCGNKICEENEEATCSQDCVTCPVYENKECAGDLVDTGYDSNHCALEPVCVISNQGVCTEDSQCPQPLCAKASCVEGQCINAELKECIPAQCIEGETKTKICDASTIIISRCVKGNWEETDQTCPVLATTPPIKTTTQTTPTTPQTTKACSVKSDCGGDSNACVAGQCTTLTKKIIPLTEKTLAQDTKINGISVTGQIISITSEGIGLTSEGITSIIGENPDLTTPPQEYKRPTTLPEDAGGSFLTGVAREENTQEEVGDFVPSQTIEEVEILAVTEGLSDEFRATGVCKTTNGETESYLKFTGGGEIFSDINYLLNQYQTGGAEWTNFELENLLEQRRILEESFNLDFVKWFFNDYLTENAENWEQAEDPINDLYNQLVENQMQIAYAMESAGIIELETYNPITIDYETEYGSLHYSEPIGLVRLPGMQTSVKILSPEIKLFILPNQEFIIREQEKAMNQKTFPGSEVTAIQRTLSKGLTPEEKTAVSQDQELVKELEALSSQTIDGILDIKISVEDSEKIVYNLYVTIDGSKIRAQPLLPGETPLTDAEITIPFADFYSLIQKSMEHSYIQKSPWNEGKGLFERINDAIGSISLYFNTNGFMNSIKISSKTIPEGEIRSAFKQIFFIVEDNSKRK